MNIVVYKQNNCIFDLSIKQHVSIMQKRVEDQKQINLELNHDFLLIDFNVNYATESLSVKGDNDDEQKILEFTFDWLNSYCEQNDLIGNFDVVTNPLTGDTVDFEITLDEFLEELDWETVLDITTHYFNSVVNEA